MPSPTSFPLPTRAAFDVPAYKQLADALILDIRRGRLRPGAKLPSTRALAKVAGVHRNTAVAAYDELLAQGFAHTRPRQGTFVTDTLTPILSPSDVAAQRPHAPGFPLIAPTVDTSRVVVPPGVLNLGGGMPDDRLAPTQELSRAYRRVLKRRGQTLLRYGDPRGEPRLISALTALLAESRRIVAHPNEVMTTRGSQMGLYLIGRALIPPGARVAVETLGYRPAWQALSTSGAALVPIAVDEHGLDVGALIAAHHRRRIDAVYLTPHHQFPTTVTLTAPRRLQLLAFAKAEGVMIIEDDYDHEFHYEGRPRAPLCADDEHGVVVYLGTLSKVFAPGLRIGYVVAARAVIDQLIAYRLVIDRQSDPAVEAAVAELIEDGELHRHMHRMRRLYRERRAVLADALKTILGERLTFRAPAGGMAIWAKTHDVDTAAWAKRAEAAGVWVTPGALYAHDAKPVNALRIGFAAARPDELRAAVDVLRATFDA